MAERKEFRKDLLFRLRSLTIELPPLREHPEDIKDLSRFHMARLCDRYGIPTKGFSPDFFDTLVSYAWPGNVRELVNTLDGALAVAGDEPTLFSRHLPMHIRIQKVRASVKKEEPIDKSFERSVNATVQLPKLREFRNSLERQYLKDLISLTKRDIKKACQISDLSRSRLYELLSKYDISISKNYNV
jgi:two-component system NtrC family response regulator